MYCFKCGTENFIGTKFCYCCGTKVDLNEQVCTSCKKENHLEAKFCYNCGTKVDLNEQVCTSCKKVNHLEAKFCYSCGKSFSDKTNRNFISTKKIKNDILLFNVSVYNKIINSGNKYLSVFLYMTSFVLSVAFFTVLCKTFPNHFFKAIYLMNKKEGIAPFLYKGYIEQTCRDLWCRLFLIILFLSVIIVDVFVFLKLLKCYKTKKCDN